MSNADLKANRTLSPHLQIYRLQMTMTMSIVHRITGIGLLGGSLLLALWLVGAATGPQAYDLVNAIATSWPGLLILIGFTWALIHHMLGGIRHFIWDFGYGMGKPARDILVTVNLVASVALTVIFWGIVLWLR